VIAQAGFLGDFPRLVELIDSIVGPVFALGRLAVSQPIMHRNRRGEFSQTGSKSALSVERRFVTRNNERRAGTQDKKADVEAAYARRTSTIRADERIDRAQHAQCLRRREC
jgi:hypothetical protein